MVNSSKPSHSRISESSLNTNLSEIAHSFVRELALSTRKVGIYGSHHPLASKSLEKPFLLYDRLFRFKKYVNLNLQRGYLYVLNIRMKDSIFCDELIQLMQVQDVSAILLKRPLGMPDFSKFVERLTKRYDLSKPENHVAQWVKKNNYDLIEVNTELAYGLFEHGRQMRGDVAGDFSAKNLACQQMGSSLVRLARINEAESDTELEELGVDFDRSIIEYLIPEIIASLSVDKIRQELTELVDLMKSSREDVDRGELVDDYALGFKMANYHPEREAIVENLAEIPDMKLKRRTAMDRSGPVETIKIESRQHIDQILHRVFNPGGEYFETTDFGDAFRRLLNTGQRGKAGDVMKKLLENLESTQTMHRQHALEMLICAVDSFNLQSDSSVIDDAVKRIVAKVTEQRETFEYSEFVWALIERLLKVRNYQIISDLVVGIAIRKRVDNDVSVFESLAIKKIFGNLNRPETLRTLIDELVRVNHDEAVQIQHILVAIGSEEVALELSKIISHPIRHVRQISLKILAELGKPALKVCSDILIDDAMFEREEGRHELPDSQWYVVRNALFVLGTLKDPDGYIPIRLRLSDPDVRVRREIITSLEKIGGDDAADLLIMMADDPVAEIREAAVVAVGIIGTEEIVPLLCDTIIRNPRVNLKGIHALGKIGGEYARQSLMTFLDDANEFERIQGKASRDDLKLAIVKALGMIGDQSSIERIKKFKDSMTTTQKIFLKNSPLNKEISQILSRTK